MPYRLRRVSIDDDCVYVVDRLLTRFEQRVLYDRFVLAGYRRGSADSRETYDIKHWSRTIPEPFARSLEIYPRIERAVEEAYGRKVSGLFRSYCNSLSYGESTYPHRDRQGAGRWVTAVVYLNLEWKPEWGGETLFFDETRDATLCVAPRPGRALLFEGHLWHRAGVPSRDFYGARLTLVFGFKLGARVTAPVPGPAPGRSRGAAAQRRRGGRRAR